MKLRKQKGFTLVEVLVVITIIGILAGLAIPRFTGQTEKARVAEAVGILSAMRRGQEVYFNENGAYLSLPPNSGFVQNSTPASWAPLGMQPPVSNFWTFYTLSGDGIAIALRKINMLPRECQVNESIRLSFNTLPGADPWATSAGCYGPGQPYHPAS